MRFQKYQNILSNVSDFEFMEVFGKPMLQIKKMILALDSGNTWNTTYATLSKKIKFLMSPIQNITFESNQQKCGSYGCVYTNAIYGSNAVALKLLKPQIKDQEIQMFFEALVNMIFYKETVNNNDLSAPKVYKFGYYKQQVAIVQERLDAKELLSLKGDTLKTAVIKICDGLFAAQRKLAFVHRDLHSRNILVGNKKVYIIDFGRACITLPTSCASLQSNEFKDDRDKRCMNRSFDISYLIVSLRSAYRDRWDTPNWLKEAAKKICLKYYEMHRDNPKPAYDLRVVETWSKYTTKQVDYFNFWYMEGLYGVDISDDDDFVLSVRDFLTEENVQKERNRKEEPEWNTGRQPRKRNPVFLKF